MIHKNHPGPSCPCFDCFRHHRSPIEVQDQARDACDAYWAAEMKHDGQPHTATHAMQSALYAQQYGRVYRPATLDAARERLDAALGMGAADAHAAMHTDPVARAIYDAATRAVADAMIEGRRAKRSANHPTTN